MENRLIDLGHLHLHIREWHGRKQPFVLLHGLASNALTWTAVADILHAAGHHVIAVDQRGHGLSDKPSDGYDFATITTDLAALLDALSLKQRPIIAGQSWGGNVVLAFGAAYPGKASQLVFVDGGTIDLQARSDATWEQIATELRPPNLTGAPRADLHTRIQSSHPDWTPAGVAATLANFQILPNDTVRPWLALDNHMRILRAMWEQRPPQLYPRVQEPVLLVMAESGSGDWATRKRQQVAAAQAGLAQSQVHWLPNTDHDIHVHRPDVLAKLLLETAVSP